MVRVLLFLISLLVTLGIGSCSRNSSTSSKVPPAPLEGICFLPMGPAPLREDEDTKISIIGAFVVIDTKERTTYIPAGICLLNRSKNS